MRMRERDNSMPRVERTPISTRSGGGAPHAGGVAVGDSLADASSSEDTVVRGEQRSAHRSKRPPPLPNRKAHKIKRIKSQRSTPWAALDPERLREIASDPVAADAAKLAEEAEARAVGATTLVRIESQLIDSEREAERQKRQIVSADPGVSAAPRGGRGRASAPSEPDRRWLLLLKVGRDELAGIWDGRLESCEPSVWRPATKTWAPLFEVPQIATLVTATVKQRQAKARASVPASPAPRRHQTSGVSIGARRSSVAARSAQGQGAARQLRASHASLPETDPPRRNDTLRPSSMAELGEQTHPLAPVARMALRSPYIPPPPRVPNLAAAAAQVHPAYADESSSGPLPSYAAEQLYRPPAPYSPTAPQSSARVFEAAQAAQMFEAAQAAQASEAAPSTSEARVIPLTRRTGRDQTPYSHYAPGESSFTPADAVLDSMHAPAVDSYAPHAHTVTPLSASHARGWGERAGVGERAGWLFAGVAAALLLTTFTGLGSSMREGVVSWLDPKPRAILASGSASQSSTASLAEPAASETAASSADASEKDAPSMVSVDELPLLTRNGKIIPARDTADEAEALNEKRDEARERNRAREREAARERDGEPSASRAQPRTAARAFVASRAEPAPPKPQPIKFDPGAARRALQSAVGRARSCATEQAKGTVVVTFAPAGGVASASLANITGDGVRKGCVLDAFRGARITPFQGDPVTVQKSFQLR